LRRRRLAIFKDAPELPMNHKWQGGPDSSNVPSAKNWSLPASSRSHSGRGGSARSGARS